VRLLHFYLEIKYSFVQVLVDGLELELALWVSPSDVLLQIVLLLHRFEAVNAFEFVFRSALVLDVATQRSLVFVRLVAIHAFKF
jgi:hypothetical protein